MDKDSDREFIDVGSLLGFVRIASRIRALRSAESHRRQLGGEVTQEADLE